MKLLFLISLIIFLSSCTIEPWKLKKAIELCGSIDQIYGLDYARVVCLDGSITRIDEK